MRLGRKLVIISTAIFFIFTTLFFPPFTNANGDCPSGNLGNLNCDPQGTIDKQDLNILLSSWIPAGPAPTPPIGQASADLSGNNKVNEVDVSILLAGWNGIVPSPTPSPTNPPSPYPRAAPRNYMFYDWRNLDLNAQYPAGAPWGSIPVFPWKDIHTGHNTFNWSPIDNYLATAASLGKVVILEIIPYESSKASTGAPAGLTCPDPSQHVSRLWNDFTPGFVVNETGGSYWVALDHYDNNGPCVDQDFPNTCWAAAVMPKYNHQKYLDALKEFILAFGAKYDPDARVQGVIFGWGIDGEFGLYTKDWGNCQVKRAMQDAGFNQGDYLNNYAKAGTNNDHTDWFATAFPHKPVYFQATSIGSGRYPIVIGQGYNNLGIKQARLTPDHNGFSDAADTGVMDLVMPWIGIRPIGWENALPVFRDFPERTQKQQVYTMMLAQLQTFTDFFDWVAGLCTNNATFTGVCAWARQYYGRTPQNTNEAWIAFQQTGWLPAGGTMNYSGWMRDWEYGLYLQSSKGTTVWRQSFTSHDGYPGHPEPGLKEIFNQQVADGYSGQARILEAGAPMTLTPANNWKGINPMINPNFDYKIQLIHVDKHGRVKVEVGDDGSWSSPQYLEAAGNASWQTTTFTFSGKKASQVKITLMDGDPLYLHMVRVCLGDCPLPLP